MRDHSADPGRAFEPVGLNNPGAERLLKDAVILVVEDEFSVALDLRLLLEAFGAVVIGPAATIEVALSLAESPMISCAILDIQLGERDVFPAAARLRERKVPFLFHTGNADGEALRRDWPDHDVLVKPVEYARLLSAVKRMVGAAAPGRLQNRSVDE